MTSRIQWVDNARGIAIVLVTLFHAALFLEPLDSDGNWLTVMKVLETFRMPLFFFAAGIFSSKILTQSFRELWNRRLSLFLYLYVLWSMIRFGYFVVCPWVLTGPHPGDWRQFVTFPIFPGGGLWFIYALAIFSVFVWVFRKAWRWIPVALSIAISVAFGSGLVPIDNEAWIKTGTYMAFFVGSVYLRSVTLRFAAWLPVWLSIILVGAYGVAATAFWVVDELRDIPGLRFAVSVVGVSAGVAISVMMTRFKSFGFVAYLGTQTLPIYLVHYIPIATFAAGMLLTDTRFDSGITAITAVPLLAGGSIAISLIVAALARNVHGLFDLPLWVTNRRRGQVPVSA